MSLYPSLEDMKVDQIQRGQDQAARDEMLARSMQQQEMQAVGITQPIAASSGSISSLYPSLSDYMGLDLVAATPQSYPVATAPQASGQVAIPNQHAPSQSLAMIAPISQQGALGMQRSEIRQGVRMIILCKDGKGKIGLRIKAVNKGIFVAHVTGGSPAAMGGVRFGDQILQIDNETVAGYSTDKVMNMLKKSNPERIEFAVRDRPFERTVTLQKDSSGHVGFIFKEGKIKSLVADSSAARNGLLIDHQLIEVNGQCVVGMKDKNVLDIMLNGGMTVTVTIMPLFLYEHIVKNIGSNLFNKQDHSVPDI